MIDPPVTLSEVAAAAGVSVSTASKALNDTDRVSAKTRAHVTETARRLGFRGNALARAFANGHSQTIGVLTHRVANPFSRAVLAGAATTLGLHEQAMLLYDARFGDEAMAESIAQLHARRIDGVIVIGDGTSFATKSITDQFEVPVVYAFTLSDHPNDLTVTADDHEIGRLAAQRFIDSGRRGIVHMTGPASDHAAIAREQGARSALNASGLDWATPPRFGSWTELWGETALGDVIAAVPDLDAIFCGNDHIARGAERRLQSLGRSVPGDVALIGVDNWERLMVDQAIQHLTTVDVGLERIGELAALHLLEPGDERGLHLVPPTLVLAETG
ncbi:LacI family DNA-binding transcriptional regulator [Subtercola endophyticus]|uniref:LacI family DNA-binding transcriptional regulator n=1 Tax=Subtercola endophyticus TaxID=2895559 RepID=UPI001E540A46|nr:LacI family DNA-binding transcriptional regulator [Subtercola endophyticus]UFS60842.1 LacI family transcriptional regulator [Subtercola endophyticus]